jgi:hypothetical protein
MMTEKKYKGVKDEHHHMLMLERVEHLNNYKSNLLTNLSKKSLTSEASQEKLRSVLGKSLSKSTFHGRNKSVATGNVKFPLIGHHDLN